MRLRAVLSRRGARVPHGTSLAATTMLLAAVLASVPAACGGKTDAVPSATPEPLATSTSTPGGDVDALMAEARSLARKSNDLTGAMWEQGQMMEVLLAPNAAAARPELEKARAMLKEIRTDQKAIVGLLEQVMRLQSSEELRTYVRQQKEIAELLLLGIDPQEQLLDDVEAMYREKGRIAAENGDIAEADMEKLFAALQPSGPEDPLAQIEAKFRLSREYFKQSGLHERYYINNGMSELYDSSVGSGEEGGGLEMPVPLAEGIYLEGPEAAEAFPTRFWGSFETSLAEAMEAERSLLEREGWTVEVKSSGKTRGVMTAESDNYAWKVTVTFEQADPGRPGKFVIRLTEA